MIMYAMTPYKTNGESLSKTIGTFWIFIMVLWELTG